MEFLRSHARRVLSTGPYDERAANAARTALIVDPTDRLANALTGALTGDEDAFVVLAEALAMTETEDQEVSNQ